ncbi:hypothetical protein AB0K51_34470 [Kitasatospora sp. NPDC049285]|uniref:hypothetical protein n=1 Tax=Kitasatospora sp. NPDC049285 TaxID=3157096 RepID=UPI00341BB877
MTRDTSVAVDPAVVPAARAAADGAWDRQLAEAFAVLLGRPLEQDGAVYAACVGSNLIDETGFRRDAAWVRPGALRGVEPVRWDCYLSDATERTPVFDASGSVFEFWESAERRAAFPVEFVTALDGACFSPGLIRGAELAPLVERFGVDLAEPAFDGAWTVFFARLRSDGSLFDAFRVALDTGTGPGDLVSFEVEAEEEWEEQLSAIGHEGLRAHLGFFCTDGDEGMMPMLEDASAGGLESAGCEPVIGWEDGFGQIEVSIVRLSDRVAGR